MTERENVLAEARRVNMRYCGVTPRVIPQGRILVHNQVIFPGKLGLNGFRAWTQDENDSAVKVCNCGFAPKINQHYRMK